MKTLKKVFKQDKEQFNIPKNVQDAIPVKTIWSDGIFLVGKNKYSKCYKFSDINYAVASREDKEAMFLEYSEVLNSFDTGATTKITIANRRLNKIDFEKNILLPKENDNLDKYRDEYNKMLLSKVQGSNGIIQEKFITISIEKKSLEEARNYFARVGTDLINHFKELGSSCEELNAIDRLRIFYDFYRTGEETTFNFDMLDNMRKGHSFKDFICPDSMEFQSDYFKIGDRYGRVIFLKEYASYIKDSMVAELTDINRNMMMSIDVIPVPMDEAVKEAENRRLGIETNITNWQRRQNANNNFSAIIPYDMEQQREQSKEFLDDLITRDQRMFLSVLTMVHTAESKEQLDNDTETLLTTARKHLCQFAILKFQQLDGLNTAMPFGVRKIDALRTLTTESLAVFMPFRVQEIRHNNGVYYGQNVISKNMIIADRKQLLNGNSFILGVSGSGKSFTAKEEIVSIMLRDSNADIILIDPEREESQLVIAKGERHGSINKIIAIAKEKGIIIVEKDKRQMDEMAQNQNYQGVIAIVPPFEYCEIEDIINYAKEKNEDPFVLILDGIEDPHNLGSIIRTAETAGAHGIIIPKRRAAAVNSTVNKVSAGAVEHMHIARVTNISDAIQKLKDEGLWICGTHINTEKYYYDQDLTGPLGIVIGNEGNGMSDKVTKNCDFLVKIPMKGKVTSLNASVSTGIIVYEAVKQRILK